MEYVILLALAIVLLGSGVLSLILVIRLREKVERMATELAFLRLHLRSTMAPQEQAPRREPEIPIERVSVPPEKGPESVPVHPPPVHAAPPPQPGVHPSGAVLSQPVTDSQIPPRTSASSSKTVTLEDRFGALEKVVGTRWLNWVGAVVMLVGIAFLLKFVYDRGWIGPAGRVAIGMAFGTGLLFLGEFRLGRRYDLLSQSVSAAGCGALFLTTFLSFKFYEFSSRSVTFGLLCWFALFTVALAVLRRGRILAFLGLLGAYLTPYLLSTGQDQAEVLFAYLGLLLAASAGVQVAREWPGILSLSLAFSLVYYAGWSEKFYSSLRLPIAAAGAAGVSVLFGAAALARGFWKRRPANAEETSVLAVAGLVGIYYFWDLLNPDHSQMLGFILCGFTLAAAGALRAGGRRQASTPALTDILLGLAAGSLLLVIPALLDADGAMLAWALGAVVFADLSARSRRVPMEIAAVVCLFAGPVVGIANSVVHTGVFVPVFNRVFIGWFGAILSCFLVGVRYRRIALGESETESRKVVDTWAPQRRAAGTALQVASSLAPVALLTYEAALWFKGQGLVPGADAASLTDWRTVTLFLLWALYPVVWMKWIRLIPRLWILIAAYYGFFGIAWLGLLGSLHARETVLFANPNFIAALLMPAAVFLVGGRIENVGSAFRSALQVYGHALLVILISVELYQGLSLAGVAPATRYWIRMALISAAWAAYATILLSVGISRDLRAWRWSALGLLGITLLKVFLLDMAQVRQIWRVLSFLVLGALLMACSYAYSRREPSRRSGAKAASPEEENP